MEIRQHLGILILAILFCFIKWASSEDIREKFKWYIPIGAGGVLAAIFEVVYWTAVLCFF